MKVVITGGLGFVGTNLAIDQLEKGREVLLIDNNYKTVGSIENKNLLLSKGAKFKYVDIRNRNDVEHFFLNKKNIEIVFHMAAQVAFKQSVENPRLDFEINALGTFNLLEAIRTITPNTVIITASTNQVYGPLPNEPVIEYEKRFDYEKLLNGVPETYPLDFLSPYGCSKGTADQYTIDYSRIYGIKTVVARFGGIYGKHQYSYEDHGWVSFITEKILKDEPFNRFGHGKQVRDVLYISDIVNALNLCAENINETNGHALNIGGGKDNSLSVLELMDIVEDITGNKEKSIINEMRRGDKLVMYLDISMAENMIGWKPNVSKEEGIIKLIKWLTKKD